jgi:hypothetical protein
VAAIIKKWAGLNASNILAQNAFLEFKSHEKKWLLNVPIQDVNRFGTMVALTSKDAHRNKKDAAFAVQ